MSPTVRIERTGARAEVVLDRPPLNVLDLAGLKPLEDAFRALGEDAGVRAILLRAEGKHFSAGVEVADHLGAKAATMIRSFHAAIEAIWACPIPTLAAVQGSALGGGLELALAADFTLAAADAKLGQPEILVGVFPPAAAALLPAEIGPKHALDLLLTGRSLSGEEALRLGLVQRAFPPDRLLEEARALADKLASLSRPVVAACKRAVRAACARPALEAYAAADRVYLEELMKTRDADEGLKAFLEKRKPVWEHC